MLVIAALLTGGVGGTPIGHTEVLDICRQILFVHAGKDTPS